MLKKELTNKQLQLVATSRSELRQTAEKLANDAQVDLTQFSQEDLCQLLHELSVHQIEIQLQNDELQNTQRELSISHQEFYQLYQHAPIAYLRIDKKGIIRQFNERFAEWVGRTHKRILGRVLAEFIEPESRVVYEFWLRSTVSRTQPRSFALISTNGAPCRHVSAQLSEQPWHEDESMLLVALTDISALKAAEDQLALAATVFEIASEGCLVTDAEHRIVLVNKAFSRITGYTQAEVLGRTPKFLDSGRHDVSFFRDFWQILIRDGHWEGEIWNRHKNGDIFPNWVSISVMYNAQKIPYRYVALYSDITQKKHQEEVIYRQATHDPLTGLVNRAYFYERLNNFISQSERNQSRVVLMMLDLDGFKDINDSFGHDVGDALLKEVATRLLRCVRKVDTVARMGGDEFTLILEMYDVTSGYLEQVTQKIIDELSAPFKTNDTVVYTSASVGIAFYPENAQSAEELQKKADQAMYVAKHRGKNQVCYFMPEMQEAAIKRRQIVSDLHQAIDTKQFSVFYQPIVTLANNRMFKAEALLRWWHPKHGLIGPDDFIFLAEETGLINPIGRWVFQQVSQDVRLWVQEIQDMQVSINVSAAQLRDINGGVDQMVLDLLRNSQSKNVVLELTERLLLERSVGVNNSLRALRAANIQVALDDFGTGYSSLAYLQEFEIDYLKIDKSFVMRLMHGANSHTLCEAIVVMAHKLGMKVIAEGIETEEQRDLLLAMGCDFGQGYFFSKALPKEQFERLWLNKQNSK